MDPANPRREVVRPTGSGPMSLEPVQKWVLSILAFTTIIHLSAGLVIASLYVDEHRTDARIGLNVIAAAFGVIAIAVFRAIHQKRLASWWLLPGLLPAVIGMWLAFR
jgi:hypothetical protein